jgi:hypothetical protein
LLVERKRRDNINQIISELSTLIPECHPGQSKGIILRKTVDYIRQIQATGTYVKQEDQEDSSSGFGRPVKRAREDDHSGSRPSKQSRHSNSSEAEDDDETPSEDDSPAAENIQTPAPAPALAVTTRPSSKHSLASLID